MYDINRIFTIEKRLDIEMSRMEKVALSKYRTAC